MTVVCVLPHQPIFVMAKFDYKNKAGGSLRHLSFKAGDVIRVEVSASIPDVSP